MRKPVENKINLLLADDDNDDCLLFQEALEELPLLTKLTTVHDGEQLLQLLTKIVSGENSNSIELPDALFLDLNMPRKNGFDALKEIKAHKILKQIPIIIFSTSYDESIANLLYQNGAHHYICKPPDFPQLIKVVHQAIKLTTKPGGRSVMVQPPKEKFLLSNLKVILF